MTQLLLFFIVFILSGTFSLSLGVIPAKAIVDPLATPNNKVGVHVFDPSEVMEAAKLVNSNGGDWGYITVPIRSNDRDTAKWTTFFDQAKKLHLIPLLRITTYPDQAAWTEPTANDLVDFANFLNGLPWPVKNRYIILFNEPNHANEWGGYLSALEYANLLSESKRIFKSRNEDFFLISAGLDMSAPNSKTSQDALSYLRQLHSFRPRWFDQVDGLAFHAYPNPAFSASVYSKTRYGPKSYTYELDLMYSQGLERSKPIFITETGTILANTGFYKAAFGEVWTEPNIVAITPFVLFAGTSDFDKFSLLDKDHQPKPTYKDIASLSKIVGSPLLSVLEPTPVPNVKVTQVILDKAKDPFRDFLDALQRFLDIFKRTERYVVGSATFEVEIKDTPKERAQGLSGRKSLAEEAGMLFIFDTPARHSFWMKDMNFALDFVWINSGVVVDITENVPPPTHDNPIPVVLMPKVAADQVLEIPAGSIKKYNIKIDDLASLE